MLYTIFHNTTRILQIRLYKNLDFKYALVYILSRCVGDQNPIGVDGPSGVGDLE